MDKEKGGGLLRLGNPAEAPGEPRSYLINDIEARNPLKLLISGRVGAKPDVWI